MRCAPDQRASESEADGITRFRPHPEVLTRKVGEEVVLVHMGRNEIFALNPTAARLWELLTEGRSRPEAVECSRASSTRARKPSSARRTAS